MIRKPSTTLLRANRKRRIRAKISGTATIPRLSVFRSNKAFSAQMIDDLAGKTLAACSTMELKEKNTVLGATAVGKALAKKCLALGIEAVVFDRSGYRYHGKVKAVADGAREGGLAL